MALDPSIYNLIGGGSDAGGIFAKIAQMGQMQGLQQQNALLQQEQSARASLQEVVSPAIDPQSGTINYQRAASLIASDPRTAPLAPELIQQFVQSGNVQAETLREQLDAEQVLVDMQSELLGSLAGNPNLTRQDVLGAIGEYWTSVNNSGFATPERREQMLAFLSAVPLDEQGLREFVTNQARRAAGAAESLKYVQPQISERDVGNAIETIQTDPITGEVTVLESVSKSMSPYEQASIGARYAEINKPSALEREVQLLMASGADPERAMGIAGGRYQAATDQYGNRIVVDLAQADGQQGLPVVPDEAEGSGVDIEGNIQGALGLPGGIASAINNLTGTALNAPLFPEVAQAREDLLTAQTTMWNRLIGTFDERTAVDMREKQGELLINPRDIFQYPARGLQKADNALEYFDSELSRLERQASGDQLTATGRQQLNERISALQNLRQQYQAIYDALESGNTNAAEERIPLEEIFREDNE